LLKKQRVTPHQPAVRPDDLFGHIALMVTSKTKNGEFSVFVRRF
jgi:hypothetical protein